MVKMHITHMSRFKSIGKINLFDHFGVKVNHTQRSITSSVMVAVKFIAYSKHI